MADVLALGAHPDDVELRIGATLASFRRAGRSVAIAHLTRGELGTRGTPELRDAEATAAARTLDAESMEILDLGDGAVEDTPSNRAILIDLLRRHAPRLVIAPFPRDEHPDHAGAGRLVKAAWYLAGIRKAGAPALAPHRAAHLWFYPSHEVPEVRFVVAVTPEDVLKKRRAVACYRSQFHDPASTEPETRISAPSFLEEGEARMRFFGSLIGAEYGEPFALFGPLGVFDPASLLDEPAS